MSELAAPLQRSGETVAIVLAAGQARRFGGGKLAATLHGRPLIMHAVDAVLEAGFRCLVVTGTPHAGPVEAALRDRDIRLVRNPNAAAGMARSIRAGIEALDPAVEAALLVLGDQPTVTAALLRDLDARWRQGGASIVVPEFRGTRAPPVLFARSVFPELIQLEGDQGARRVVERDPARVAILPVDMSPPGDVDTLDDLARLETDRR